MIDLFCFFQYQSGITIAFNVKKNGYCMSNLIVIGHQLKIEDFIDKINSKIFEILYFDELASAYDRLVSDQFNVLVLDVDNGNYLNYRNILKSNGFHNHLSIVALTSDDSLENIRNLKESNINEIVIKPVDKSRFNKILLNIIDQRELA